MKKLISLILAITSLVTTTVALSGCGLDDKEYYTYRVCEWKENPTEADYDEYGRGPRRLQYYNGNTSATEGKVTIAEYSRTIVGGTDPGYNSYAMVQNRWVDVEGTLYHADGTTTVLEKEQRDIVGGEFSFIGGIALYKNEPEETTFKSYTDVSTNRIAVKIGEYDVFVQWGDNLIYNLYKYFNCETTEISLLSYEAPNINGIEKMQSYTEMKITGEKDGKAVDVELRVNDSDRYVNGPKNTAGCVEKFRYLYDGVGYDLSFSNYQYSEVDGYANRDWLHVGGGYSNSRPSYADNLLTLPTKITVNGKQENVAVDNVEASNIYLDIEDRGTCSIGTSYDFTYYYDTDEFIFMIDSVKKLANFQTTNSNITVKMNEDMFVSENNLVVYELEIKTTVNGQGTAIQYTRFAFDPMTGLIKEFTNKLDDNGTVKETNLTISYEWAE